MLLDGQAIPDVDRHGQRIAGDTLLIWFNGGPGDVTCVLPSTGLGSAWEEILNSAAPDRDRLRSGAGTHWRLAAQSSAVFRLTFD